MELILVKIDSLEWEFMWNWLAQHPLNKGLENPTSALNDDEQWQYTGSYKSDSRVVHSFRHRNHPKTGTPQYLSVSASENFNENQIQSKHKV